MISVKHPETSDKVTDNKVMLRLTAYISCSACDLTMSIHKVQCWIHLDATSKFFYKASILDHLSSSSADGEFKLRSGSCVVKLLLQLSHQNYLDQLNRLCHDLLLLWTNTVADS